MKENKVKQPESREIQRSLINFANYNPRKITPEARKKLKANIKRVGILGGIVWNEETGNLVSGHQRVSVIDEVNRYNAENGENDYLLKVEVVHMTEKEEKEQNIFMNNRSVQGEFDSDMLKDMLADIDFDMAGFDEFDLNMLGIGENDFADVGGSWDVREQDRDKVESYNTSSEEDRTIDRSKNFYEDTEENQIKRHNEIQKIKDRISSQNDSDKDNGSLSYVVISFNTPSEREDCMSLLGYGPEDRYIDGGEFAHRLEFGVEE